jgi:hypothetical protein
MEWLVTLAVILLCAASYGLVFNGALYAYVRLRERQRVMNDPPAGEL